MRRHLWKFQSNTGETGKGRPQSKSIGPHNGAGGVVELPDSAGTGRPITDFCDTLISVKAHKNVTLSLPEALLRRFRVYAAARNQSMTSLMAEAIRAMMDQDRQTEVAKRRFLERLRKGYSLGTHGVASWTRDEIHER
jgi:predicted transcriptional regulator